MTKFYKFDSYDQFKNYSLELKKRRRKIIHSIDEELEKCLQDHRKTRNRVRDFFDNKKRKCSDEIQENPEALRKAEMELHRSEIEIMDDLKSQCTDSLNESLSKNSNTFILNLLLEEQEICSNMKKEIESDERTHEDWIRGISDLIFEKFGVKYTFAFLKRDVTWATRDFKGYYRNSGTDKKIISAFVVKSFDFTKLSGDEILEKSREGRDVIIYEVIDAKVFDSSKYFKATKILTGMKTSIENFAYEVVFQALKNVEKDEFVIEQEGKKPITKVKEVLGTKFD